MNQVKIYAMTHNTGRYIVHCITVKEKIEEFFYTLRSGLLFLADLVSQVSMLFLTSSRFQNL